jgi:hypothetical protein
VLTAAQIRGLVDALEAIQGRFRELYGALDRSFAMDVEFKIGGGGRLVVEQSRPWVD